MITILAKFFLHEEGSPSEIRERYGILCGLVGIFLNVVLFAGKLFAGSICHSIAITADAFNNLSDAGSSAVTLAGFHLAGQKPDTEHPFGHGRIEYVSGLIVAAAILIMGFELIRDSVEKILHPQATEFSMVSVGILLASIAVKFYMSFYNRRLGNKLDSAVMRATAADSLSDTVATAVVLISMLIGHFTGILIDGWCGALVGIFIFVAGVSAAKDTLNPLLGQPPEESFVQQISDIVMSHEGVMGIHDLVVHDYGPGRQMISLHAEVPAEDNVLEIHDLIDRIEMELNEKLFCEAVIHMDPIVTKDEATRRIRTQVEEIVNSVGEVLSMHDFRMVPGATHTNLIFDVVIPFGFSMEDEEVTREIQERIAKDIGENYFAVMQVDKARVK